MRASLHAAGRRTPEPLAYRYLPRSEGGGNPKPIMFMLDNELYLHPSLSSNGDHKDKPDHLDHLGNGEGWKQWGSAVCAHARHCRCELLAAPGLVLASMAWDFCKWRFCSYMLGAAGDSAVMFV